MAYPLSFTIKNILTTDGINQVITHFVSCDHMPVKGYFVQDINEQQNLELFLKGLNTILTMEGKRGAFLRTFVAYMVMLNNTKVRMQNHSFASGPYV